MKRRVPFLAAALFAGLACACVHDFPAAVSLVRETAFTGRGNTGETLLEMRVVPDKPGKIRYVKVFLDASAADVSALSLMAGDRELDRAGVRDGKALYVLSCGERISDTTCFRICADVRPEATEGNRISADVRRVQMRGSIVAPQRPDPGFREILLCRKRLFAPGDYGSNFWRIPAIRQLQDGTLLVVNDRRNVTQKDLPGEIDVVSRYSTDRGRTWSEPVFLARNQGPEHGYGDPGLVELEDGTVICTFCGGESFYGSSVDKPQRSYMVVSKDHGRTWSEPRELTWTLWGPNPDNPFCTRYHSSFFTSGNSLLLTRGPYKGRILVANVTAREGYKLSNHAVYSDDGGETWHVSDLAWGDSGDEAKMVQLLDGRILMSVRRNGPRGYVISEDGGQTWGEHHFWPQITVTDCNGDLIRYDDRILLHSVPNSARRENVSVFLSFDEGRSWPVHKTICRKASMYSSLTVLDDKTIGAYVEENTDGVELWYLNFSLDWLQRQ